MSERERPRQPILKIDFVVEKHTTDENKDKADQYTIVMKTPEKSLKIGLEDAKSALKIKAGDDIVKNQFPLYGEFSVEIYLKKKSPVNPKDSTQQHPLQEDSR